MSSTIVCASFPDVGKPGDKAETDSYLWTDKALKIQLLDSNEDQRIAVKQVFKEYAVYGNIDFTFVDNSDTSGAQIRITFSKPTEAWSAIGSQALKILAPAPTMSLGFIGTSGNTNPAMLYHQVGHALGLGHEWDGQNVQLIETGENKEILKHIQPFKGQTISNIAKIDIDKARIDKKSVMNYWLPAGVATGEVVAVPVDSNATLSEYDKCWIVINYPGRIAVVGPEEAPRKWTLIYACSVLDIGGDMQDIVSDKKDVKVKRAAYAKYLASHLESINKPVSHHDDPSPVNLTDDYDTIAAILLHPEFHSSVAKMVASDLRQNKALKEGSESSSNPEDIQQFAFLLPLLLPAITNLAGKAIGGMVGNGIQPGGVGFYPGSSGDLHPDIQQGIFTHVISALKSPTFKNLIRSAVDGILKDTPK